MWKEYYVAALLFLNGVWDWKKREVCLPSILVSLAAGLVGACWYQELSIRDLAGGLGIGVWEKPVGRIPFLLCRFYAQRSF